ncbi:MAG: hypothetical protein ACOCYD_00415 [bacterium]
MYKNHFPVKNENPQTFPAYGSVWEYIPSKSPFQMFSYKTKYLLTLVWMVILIKGLSFSGYGQNNFEFHEDSLKRMMQRIILPEHDFERLAINHDFKTYFEKVLQEEGAFHYPFDSLTVVSRITAPDESFRIISWYVPLQNGQFEYFGFFLSPHSKGEGHQLYNLTDKVTELSNPSFETLDHENWYGAYYTQLIHKKHRRKDYYLLLGWRADNPLTRKRVLEPIQVMGKGRPSFGKPMFRYDNNKHRRIIFEYSAKASMVIRYETHSLEQSRRPREIIIFDRMEPSHDFLKGNYQFYFPETNIFDAFMFDSGKWIFVPDVDARNPRRSPPPRPVAPRNN